jgi:enoyl-CoA hydratase/carnithine racemase
MELTTYETLTTEMVEPHVLLVTINRPDVANALNTQMGRDFYDLWTRLTEDAGDVRCVVLTAAGGKVFCAGGDLKERNGMDKHQWRRQHELFERMYWALTDMPVPVIAAVNGHAYAGGFETALSCDIIYAANTARFALTEVTLGIMPGAGGTQTLSRAVGLRRAKQLIFTAMPFSAAEAHEWGLLNAVFSADDLMPETLKIAKRIAGNAPISIRQAKRAMQVGYDTDLKTGLALEVEAYNRMVPTADRREGITAFNEKRPPRFTGR